MKKLTVIIVNYNVCYFLEQTLKSTIRAIRDIDAEIIVVDNNSVDGSVELVKSKFPEVKIIENRKNTGFSKANNQAIRIARGEYILLLNPDTFVEENTLQKCCDFMDDHPDAGGLGIKMVDGKGNFLPESKRGLPTPSVAFYKVSGLAALLSRMRPFGNYHLGYLDEDQTHQIEILSGAFMFLRHSVLDKIGYLDEDYFMYGEDIDLSYRILKAGYKNYYYPEARIIHYKGESTKKTSVNYVFIFYRAMIIFARKHFSYSNARIFAFLINIAIYFKAFAHILINFISSISFSVIDALMIYGGLYLLRGKYGFNEEIDYNGASSTGIVYIMIWLLSNHFSGGNDRPYRLANIIRGVFIGTVLIAALTNFFDSYVFSKTLILAGSLVTAGVLLFNRTIFHLYKYRSFSFTQSHSKKAVLVGDQDEIDRVNDLLKRINARINVVGYVTADIKKERTSHHLGYVDQLGEILEIYKIDEIIFCSKNIPAHQIIEMMINIENKLVDFKIVPHDSNYIIGSNSRNRPGDFYTIDIKLNITEPHNIRNKRVLDVLISAIGLISYPVLAFFVKNPWNFLKNNFRVLFGKYTWVGFANRDGVHLPKIRKGILSPGFNMKGQAVDNTTLKRMDTLYAKEYDITTDITIILRSIPYLGR